MSLGGRPGALGPTPSLLGIPVIVSGNVPGSGGLSDIVLLDQAQVLLADDVRRLPRRLHWILWLLDDLGQEWPGKPFDG